MDYIKKVDLLAAAVEVEYLGRPRMMVSVATIGKMPSIEAVPMEYHNKVCENMARRHQAEILELTADRPQGERDKEIVRCEACAKWREDKSFCTQWSCGTPGAGWCYMAKQMKGADDE